MAVSGPNGYNSDISSYIQPDGTRVYLGTDNYTARTDVISGGREGDVYCCNVTSVKSTIGNVTVRGSNKKIISLHGSLVKFYCSWCSTHHITEANSSHYSPSELVPNTGHPYLWIQSVLLSN